jgi:hypothetical protein
VAADLTPLARPAARQPQACHFDAIGCSAARTDRKHRRNRPAQEPAGSLAAVC